MFFRSHSLHPLHVPYNGRHVSRIYEPSRGRMHPCSHQGRTYVSDGAYFGTHGAGASLSPLVSRSVSRDVARDPRTGLWDYFQILKIISHT